MVNLKFFASSASEIVIVVSMLAIVLTAIMMKIITTISFLLLIMLVCMIIFGTIAFTVTSPVVVSVPVIVEKGGAWARPSGEQGLLKLELERRPLSRLIMATVRSTQAARHARQPACSRRMLLEG